MGHVIQAEIAAGGRPPAGEGDVEAVGERDPGGGALQFGQMSAR